MGSTSLGVFCTLPISTMAPLSDLAVMSQRSGAKSGRRSLRWNGYGGDRRALAVGERKIVGIAPLASPQLERRMRIADRRNILGPHLPDS
jgi:hypothetical protein